MAAAPPPAPARIQPLPKLVVDRIAAGEVVQRPASIAKELIENSLDASSTTIDIQCQAGGMRLLAVADDGCGISPPDLQLAATRFATSKLVALDDLKSIRTFGFRGEALASASMVARLSITSRKRRRGAVADDDEKKYSNSCAYKQSYKDGKPTATKPTPSAGRDGTTIKVEDLFYNVPSRRRAFAGNRKEAEEYTRILNVAERYALHKAGCGVGLVCRKKGGQADLNTPSLPSVRSLKEKRIKLMQQTQQTTTDEQTSNGNTNSNTTATITKEEAEGATKDVVGHVFGSAVAKELLTLRSSEGDVDAVSLAALEAMRNEQQPKNKETELAKNNDGTDEQQCSSNNNNGENGDGDTITNQNTCNANDDDGKVGRYTFAYRAFGLITNGSFCAPKSSSAFVLFINDRLVESAPLRRAVESIYADSLPRGAKPFVYLSLELPGPHVDVNVHPTKREVAFLHEDRLCDALARATKEVLGSAQSSRTFYAQAVLPATMTGCDAGTIDEDNDASTASKKKNKDSVSRAAAAATAVIRAKNANADGGGNAAGTSENGQAKQRGTQGSNTSSYPNTDGEEEDMDTVESSSRKRRAAASAGSSSAKKPYNPSRLVRTHNAAPAGALEPFLVPTQTQLSQSQSQSLSQSQTNDEEEEQSPSKLGEGSIATGQAAATATFQHSEDCELARGSQSIDMSVPGAFTAICRCQVERGNTLPAIQRGASSLTNDSAGSTSTSASNAIVRPKRVVPTNCSYSSIQTLRGDIAARAHRDLTTKLRDSTFVGCISRSRSLIQWGIELLMINHTELGKELFYQLSLARFGGAPRAELGGGGINVKHAVEQAMQLEQDIASGVIGGTKIGTTTSVEDSTPGVTTKKPLTVSETNSDLAAQIVELLTSKAEMLDEYFSIRFSKQKDPESGEEALMLVGLPVLLQGHSPPPHALPLFLLRLATEVDWEQERPCFHDICTELGNYYAEIPFDLDPEPSKVDDEASDDGDKSQSEPETDSEPEADKAMQLIDEAAKHFVKHTLYPAISFLLVPPKDLASNGAVVKLALLSSLYKVFERC